MATGAVFLTLLIELWIVVAHLLLPAVEIDGYVQDSKGKPLKYRLNGIPVLIATVLAWAGLCWAGALPWDYLYEHTWIMCATACAAGLLTTTVLVAQGPQQTTSYPTDFFLGRILNPRPVVAGRIFDIKMYLYLVGAVHLELNILSYTAAHWLRRPSDSNPGVALAAGLLSWFVTEYLWWENVHLYTYDLFAERVGFKLTWGCLCFYPFFYPIGILAAVDMPNPHRSMAYHVLAAAIYFGGWGLSRTANLQKFWFKQAKARGSPPSPGTVIRSANGKHELFCGGLWGVARHVNYLGEILEAAGIALAVGYPLQLLSPWLYPVYYVLLLVPRERDDDARCKEKYGALWDEYCKRAPYRIIPYVY